MALTQITTDGIKDGTITGTDLTTNVDFVDNQKLRLGTGNDLEIYHDGSHSFIDNDTGHLTVTASQINLNNQDNSENCATLVGNGAVNLFFNGSKKFETTSNGVNITSGTPFLTVTASDNDGDATLNLVAKSQDGSIVGGISRIVSESSSNSNGASAMSLQTRNSSNTVTTAIRIDKDQDVTLPIDNQKLRFGASQDLQIYHDGSNSYINNDTQYLQIQSSYGVLLQRHDGSENLLRALSNGAVELYYDGNKKFETTSAGVSVTGVQAINGGLTDTPFTIDAAASNGPHMRFKKNGADLHFVGCAPGIGAGGDSEDMAIRFEDQLFFNRNGTNFAKIDNTAFYPNVNNTYDLGSTSKRWRNIYTNDLNLSNEGGANDVDMTWGSYTIQEGHNDLFLINKRTGKKYKFNLTEVS